MAEMTFHLRKSQQELPMIYVQETLLGELQRAF